MQNKYWATKSSDEFLNELNAKVETYDKHLQTSGIINQLRDAFDSYYGDTKIRNVGDAVTLKINHFA